MDWNRKLKVQLLSAILLWIVIAMTLSSTIALFHNSPVNTADTSFDDLNQSDVNVTVNGENQSFGLTYGQRNASLDNQSFVMNLGLMIVGPVFPLVIAFVGLLWWIWNYGPSRMRSQNGNIKLHYATLGMAFMYYLFSLFAYNLLPRVRYISVDYRNGVYLACAGADITPKFWLLIGFQSVIFATVAGIWTRPIIPDTVRSNDTDISGVKKLEIHLENWRKFGSWAVTLIGGVIITSGIAFVGQLPFGGFFVQHVIIVCGGAVLLILAYVIYTLDELKWVIGEVYRRHS